jgi:hypothetical protein
MGGMAIVETKFDKDTYFGGSMRQTFIIQSYIPNGISGKDPIHQRLGKRLITIKKHKFIVKDESEGLTRANLKIPTQPNPAANPPHPFIKVGYPTKSAPRTCVSTG